MRKPVLKWANEQMDRMLCKVIKVTTGKTKTKV